MLLSEMLGVERDVDFEAIGYIGRFILRARSDGIERLWWRLKDHQVYVNADLEVLYDVIFNAPSGIIHLPPPLTDEQRVVLMSLFTIGARYMGMSRDGWKRCFVNKPQKEHCGWTCGDTQVLFIAPGMANCLDSLVSWSDTEPYDIDKALGIKN